MAPTTFIQYLNIVWRMCWKMTPLPVITKCYRNSCYQVGWREKRDVLLNNFTVTYIFVSFSMTCIRNTWTILHFLSFSTLFQWIMNRNCTETSGWKSTTYFPFLFKFNNGFRAGPQSMSGFIRLNSALMAVPHSLNFCVSLSCAAQASTRRCSRMAVNISCGKSGHTFNETGMAESKPSASAALMIVFEPKNRRWCIWCQQMMVCSLRPNRKIAASTLNNSEWSWLNNISCDFERRNQMI